MEAGLGWVIAAYTVVLGGLGIYALGLVRRERRARAELDAARAERASRSG